jgi:hypothetical protein
MTIRPEVGGCITRAQRHSVGGKEIAVRRKVSRLYSLIKITFPEQGQGVTIKEHIRSVRTSHDCVCTSLAARRRWGQGC